MVTFRTNQGPGSWWAVGFNILQALEKDRTTCRPWGLVSRASLGRPGHACMSQARAAALSEVGWGLGGEERSQEADTWSCLHP